MSTMLQKLNNIRTLRAMSREFSIDVLEEMLEKFRVVTEEKRAEEESLQESLAEKQKKINALLEMMQADGISPDDILGKSAGGASTRKRAARPAKYRYTDLDGEQKTWTGQGRTPKPIAKALAEGKSLNDFLI
ncbi:MAG: DNA-binding protein StpA [Scandinavium sp.]|uniref:DNA-binding protein StpA n=1 Tax=Scandinavium sp. TaxID=2830653 RepID=UPI003F345387